MNRYRYNERRSQVCPTVPVSQLSQTGMWWDKVGHQLKPQTQKGEHNAMKRTLEYNITEEEYSRLRRQNVLRLPERRPVASAEFVKAFTVRFVPPSAIMKA